MSIAILVERPALVGFIASAGLNLHNGAIPHPLSAIGGVSLENKLLTRIEPPPPIAVAIAAEKPHFGAGISRANSEASVAVVAITGAIVEKLRGRTAPAKVETLTAVASRRTELGKDPRKVACVFTLPAQICVRNGSDLIVPVSVVLPLLLVATTVAIGENDTGTLPTVAAGAAVVVGFQTEKIAISLPHLKVIITVTGEELEVCTSSRSAHANASIARTGAEAYKFVPLDGRRDGKDQRRDDGTSSDDGPHGSKQINVLPELK